ncbi:MAG: gamma carbonic anhydrase family protein [Cellvibrionaceae bacterium]|nr:gamma carbonic anhydrase family protein [Cellvibrionaceae bacterium]
MKYRLGNKAPQLLGENHFIAPSADVIGDVVLHDNASIWFNAVLRGDNDTITIGENSNVQDGAVLHTDPGVQLNLGKGVIIGHNVMLHGCDIGDNSLIGIGAVVLNRVKIGKNCIIGANALVTEGTEIPDNSMVLGSPAKVVKQIDGATAEFLKLNAQVYVDNLGRFNAELEPLD